MKNNRNIPALVSGFTLIELLVVVLIIGILAAVALPQYQQAVNKTRFANLEKLAKSFTKASEIYFLANNKWPTQFDDLDIDLPSGFNIKSIEGGPCGQTDKIYCCIIPNSGYSPAIVCGQNDYSFAFHTLSHRNEPFWSDYCIAKQTDTAAVKLCNSLGTATFYGWNFFTPEGSKTGYKYYLLK